MRRDRQSLDQIGSLVFEDHRAEFRLEPHDGYQQSQGLLVGSGNERFGAVWCDALDDTIDWLPLEQGVGRRDHDSVSPRHDDPQNAGPLCDLEHVLFHVAQVVAHQLGSNGPSKVTPAKATT